MHYLDELNPAQRKAAEHTKGPLMILAGAGAGKTKTITYRIAHLMEQGVSGDAILAVTFTNKAAGEMRERIMHVLATVPQGQSPLASVHGGLPLATTFHALCVRLLREHAAYLELPRSFTIWDRDDQLKAVKQALEHFGYGKQHEPRTILSRISREKGDAVTHDMFAPRAKNPWEQTVAQLWGHYEEVLRKDRALDFDDLLLRTLTLLQKHPAVLEKLQSRFAYITIDEYQDTNRVQFEIAKLLAGPHMNICVVGDVDQNIYSWRGADIQHLLTFERVFPHTTVVVLEENYRSTQTILTAANDIISKNKNRYDKKLFTKNTEGEPLALYSAMSEQDEARHVAQTASALIAEGVPPEEIAVLYRANFQSRALEDAFLQQGTAYRVLGTRFFERKEVKDLLSYLRAAGNPESRVDLARISSSPPRGIGKATLTHMLEGSLHLLAPAARKKVEGFYEMLARIQHAVETMRTSEAVRTAFEVSGLAAHYHTGNEDDTERLGNLKELVSLSVKYDTEEPPAGIERLLEDAALLGEQDALDKTQEAVSLMTIHAAKGLEFEHVFITGLEEGLFPMERRGENEDSEEERRLLYVAITRARKKVFLSHAATRLVYGSRDITIPSRFIGDIDPALVHITAPSLLESWGGERWII